MDIFFYDFSFECLYTLPKYIMIDTTTEINGNGSFELSFFNADVAEIIISHPGELFIKWGDFEGIVTDYQFTDNLHKIYGYHLNYLLHKTVIPSGTLSGGNIQQRVLYIMSYSFNWIALKTVSGISADMSDYITDDYKNGDSYFQTLFAQNNIGYKISLDFTQNKPLFELIPYADNQLIFSSGNLNAYDFCEDYNGKTAAYSGWYNDNSEDNTERVWTKITTDSSKTGLSSQEIVLSATTAAEAITELRHKTAEYNMTCKTKNISYGIDYKLGDVIRIQNNGTTVKKVITGVNIWHEQNQYCIEPIFSKWEE